MATRLPRSSMPILRSLTVHCSRPPPTRDCRIHRPRFEASIERSPDAANNSQRGRSVAALCVNSVPVDLGRRALAYCRGAWVGVAAVGVDEDVTVGVTVGARAGVVVGVDWTTGVAVVVTSGSTTTTPS